MNIIIYLIKNNNKKKFSIKDLPIVKKAIVECDDILIFNKKISMQAKMIIPGDVINISGNNYTVLGTDYDYLFNQ